MENTKRDLSLDFTKPRHTRSGQPAPSLVTPILALSTPELNKMISGEELAVLTPNGISSVIPQSNGVGTVLPSPLIPTTVNSNNIIHTNCNNNINNNSNTNNNNSHNLRRSQQQLHNQHQLQNHQQLHQDNNNNKSIGKDLDIEKIEKKRERNRLAAKKCRQRKLETIDELRKTVSDWEKKYEHLEEEFKHFKALRNKEIEQLTLENSKLKSLMRQ